MHTTGMIPTPNEDDTTIKEYTKIETLNEDVPSTSLMKTNIGDEIPADEKPRIIHIYTLDELLELRRVPASLEKPAVLLDEFFNKEGVWDPEAWFKSKESRSSSPAVIDGKPIIEEKKICDISGDDIELAPHSGSFKQGCQVKNVHSNGLLRPSVDRKNRLTGRAANQRKPLETNYKDGNSISERTQDFEKMRKEAHFLDRDDRFQDRGYRSNDRYKNKAFSTDENSSNRDRDTFRAARKLAVNHKQQQQRKDNNSMPEWMTDGPTSQLDTIELFTHKDIEEEKKAFAKKNKKIRISPDVETHHIMKISKPQKRKTPSPKLNGTEDQNKQRKNSQEKGGFELDVFLKSVDYYPPKRFQEDLVNGDGVKSRFTQYFQQNPTQPSHDGNKRSPSLGAATESLVPDEVFTGPKVPIQQPYFTPIQPAPALLNAAANAHAVQSSNIADIIHKQKQHQLEENLKKASKEVRGRLNVEQLEGETTSKPVQKETDKKPVDESAFNMFLKTMKDAGQLPEKPSPVVSGLPVHLLPQPPTRTSPVFEKLKRSLSRSPSPKEFAKAVSTVADILSTNPSIDRELSILQKKNSTDVTLRDQNDSSPLDQSINNVHYQTPKSGSSASHFSTDGTPSSYQLKKAPKNAFTPTSVLKKMHNDRKEDCASPSPLKEQSDASSVNISSDGRYPDLLPQKVRDQKDVEKNLNKQFSDAIVTPDRSKGDSLFSPSSIMTFHSAPPTPQNQTFAHKLEAASISAPGTPGNRQNTDPPEVNRLYMKAPGYRGSSLTDLSSASRDSAFGSVKSSPLIPEPFLMTPSAFQTIEKPPTKSVGIIGSGAPPRSQENSIAERLGKLNVGDRPQAYSADSKLAPGTGAGLRQTRTADSPPVSSLVNPLQQLANQQQHHNQQSNTHSHAPSQQQQLLQAQRRAQIQQAQLLQQQKLREIANQANQQMTYSQNQTAARHLLPDPEKSSQQQHQPRQRPLYQQTQHQQLLAYQQQQKQQQQQMLAQHQRQFRGASPMPFPPGQMGGPNQQPRLPVPLQQQPGVGLQPFMQNQVNPAFANVNLTAQALMQQQLINQARAKLMQAQFLHQQPQVVQAALMAQAALVRGQAQAQAAMMLNPRNMHIMAEQMGLRPSHKQQQQQQHQQPQQPVVSPVQSSNASGDNNLLSKWFSNDVLQHMPSKASVPADLGKAKVLSVEELERNA